MLILWWWMIKSIFKIYLFFIYNLLKKKLYNIQSAKVLLLPSKYYYCDSNSFRSFTLLNVLAKSNIILLSPLSARKSDNYLYRDPIVGRAITLERKPPKKKQRTDTKMQRFLRVITLQWAILLYSLMGVTQLNS